MQDYHSAALCGTTLPQLLVPLCRSGVAWLVPDSMQAAPDELFKALADPTRRAIFERLIRDGELTVRTLTDQAGVSQPAVSKPLGVLKLAGLVRDRPEGRLVHYRETTARQHLSGLYRRTGCLNAAQAAYRLGAGEWRPWRPTGVAGPRA